MFVTSLLAQLDTISQLSRPARRGLELERFVADLFRQHHFKVDLNPGTARPRQTDVLATKGLDVYLVECKWRSDKANIDDLDSLRSRLRRTSGGVVGVLVSYSGFSGSVLFDAEHQRNQPILLLSGDEIMLIASRPELLPDLLWRKRDALLTDGRVLLDEPNRGRSAKRRLTALPPAENRFVLPDGQRRYVIECDGTFGQFVFVHDLPDIDWVPASGVGATLDIAPRVFNQRGLLDLLGKLPELGWATPDAKWSIQQSRKNWHGLGAAAFADELPRWKQRADSPDAHHSEEICYVDHCDGGFYTLTANLAAHKSRRTTLVGLSFQLQGTPLDTGALLQLCRSVGVHDGLYFRTRMGESVVRQPARTTVEKVQVVGLLTEITHDGDFPSVEWVTGIVIVNPYRQGSDIRPPEKLPDGLQILGDSEHLVCGLVQHHPLDDKRYAYHLQGFEHASTSDATVCRPIADWEPIDPVPSAEDQPPVHRRRTG
jgi:hypothetical protein